MVAACKDGSTMQLQHAALVVACRDGSGMQMAKQMTTVFWE